MENTKEDWNFDFMTDKELKVILRLCFEKPGVISKGKKEKLEKLKDVSAARMFVCKEELGKCIVSMSQTINLLLDERNENLSGENVSDEVSLTESLSPEEVENMFFDL